MRSDHTKPARASRSLPRAIENRMITMWGGSPEPPSARALLRAAFGRAALESRPTCILIQQHRLGREYLSFSRLT